MKSLMILALLLGISHFDAVSSADLTSSAPPAGCEGNAGIGADERESMEAARQEHNLRLTFATKVTGEYQADVAVTLSDQVGKPVASFVSPGPICDLDIAPGHYRVTATVHGDTLSRIAVVRTLTGGADECH
ncbi:hypothetical protein GTP56_17195 [Duganella sp. FT134W]|uniref:Carboxypeptidase regulatory-like domain-containing protein n=1 Tax=Duganella margarita TaxID=2692170 RepID=A0A7X4KI59_9BURK|nr:hypothetical protein [Duganella margarita]MYM73927.1 hypothetical protein [Duganella margarita]